MFVEDFGVELAYFLLYGLFPVSIIALTPALALFCMNILFMHRNWLCSHYVHNIHMASDNRF